MAMIATNVAMVLLLTNNLSLDVLAMCLPCGKSLMNGEIIMEKTHRFYRLEKEFDPVAELGCTCNVFTLR